MNMGFKLNGIVTIIVNLGKSRYSTGNTIHAPEVNLSFPQRMFQTEGPREPLA